MRSAVISIFRSNGSDCKYFNFLISGIVIYLLSASDTSTILFMMQLLHFSSISDCVKSEFEYLHMLSQICSVNSSFGSLRINVIFTSHFYNSITSTTAARASKRLIIVFKDLFIFLFPFIKIIISKNLSDNIIKARTI